VNLKISLPLEKIQSFCKDHHIRKLSFFGSILREDFGPNSDVDILVEFEKGTKIGFFRFVQLENQLRQIIGRKVDLKTPNALSPFFRGEVLKEAEVSYEQTK